jgi:TolB-like protein
MPTRRLAAILFADVAGYTRLMHEDEEGTHGWFTALMAAAVEPALEQTEGRLVKSTGDGFVAEFNSALAAVRCALCFQAEAARLTISSDPERRLALRVGIHLGDIIVEERDVYGDGVNIAARLETEAQPGSILVSGTVYENVRGRIGCAFQDLGEHQLKNIANPVRIVRVIAAAEENTAAQPPLALPDIPSIVVLPFRYLGGDPEQEYFADGIVDDITTALSRSRSVFVIARNSAFTYKGRTIDVRQVGRELGVRYVLEGSVRLARQRIFITSELVQADTATQIWAERHERGADEVFVVQDEIVNAVAAAIEPAIGEAEHRRAARRSPLSLGAWETYHRALWHHFRSNAADNAIAQGHFQRAVSLDPEFSPAHQGLVFSYLDDAILYLTRKTVEAAELADPLARKAVLLDPSDARAYVALAYVAFARGDLETALANAEQGLALNPNCTGAHWSKSGCSLYLGRYSESQQAATTFLRLNPRDPRNWRVLNHLAIGHYMLEDYSEAVLAARQALRTHPDQPLTYRWLVAALGQLGRKEEAKVVMREAATVLAPVPFTTYAKTRGAWLREGDHAKLLDGLRKAELDEG